jgi:hypothetical protein
MSMDCARFITGGGIGIDARPLGKRGEAGDDPPARLRAGKTRRIRSLYAEDDVRARQRGRSIAYLSARRHIIGIGNGREDAGTAFDGNFGAERDELLGRFRRRGNPRLPGRRLPKDGDPDCHQEISA